MTIELDPQGVELRALTDAVDLADRRLLEIGAGDGRLTARIAAAPRLAAGLDPDLGSLARAAGERSPPPAPGPGFLAGTALALPFRDHAFDLALFAWSL